MPLSHFLAQLLWLVFSVLCWINVVRLDILIFLLTLQNDDNNNNNNNNSSNNNNNKTLSVSWLSMMLAFEYDSGFLFPSVLCSLSLSFPSGIPYGKCCYVWWCPWVPLAYSSSSCLWFVSSLVAFCVALLSFSLWIHLLPPVICHRFPLVYLFFFISLSSYLWWLIFFFLCSLSLLELWLVSSTLFSNPLGIFLTITLNSLWGIFSSLGQLALLLWFCPIVSFGSYSSVSSFCLTLCVCFSVLGKSAPSPTLESRGLMKNRSCSALQSDAPWSPWHYRGCLLCLLHAPYSCSWAVFAFGLLICSGSLCGSQTRCLPVSPLLGLS